MLKYVFIASATTLIAGSSYYLYNYIQEEIDKQRKLDQIRELDKRRNTDPKVAEFCGEQIEGYIAEIYPPKQKSAHQTQIQ